MAENKTKYQKKLAVRRDDTVIMISGDDKGKKGKVVEVSMPARHSFTAPNATKAFVPLTRSWTARRSAFAQNAAKNFKLGRI